MIRSPRVRSVRDTVRSTVRPTLRPTARSTSLFAAVLLFSLVSTPVHSQPHGSDPQEPCSTCASTLAAGAVGPVSGGLFDTQDFPPRWNCGTWSATHGWVHIVSDVFIWLAYISIPFLLLIFRRCRPDLPFRGVFVLFGAFIVLCGFTHLLEALLFWWPAYRFLGLVKVACAIVSIWTAIVCVRVIPAALALKSPAELEATVQERTKSLEERDRELSAAKEAAERGSRSKSEFLANMSHEIRTPLTSILGYAEILRGTARDPEATEAAGTIYRNSEHLLGVLNDILDLSKIEAGKLDIEPRPCEVREFLDDPVDLFRVAAREKGVELRLEVDPRAPEYCRTDSRRVAQILMNLLGNALKFTSNGSIVVSVRTNADRDLEIAVEDTGIGMSKDAKERIFDAFSQAEVSTSRKFGGTGLGLTISARLAELLGGRLVLERSAPGQGSRFTLTIPRGDVPLRRPSTVAAKVHETVAQGATLDGVDVVLAEDSPDTHRLLAHLLSKAGAQVEGALTGAEVIEIVSRRLEAGQLPDLIVMDMQMPELDGFQATRVLRELGFEGPILALTAHAMSEAEERCRAVGCDGFESKPVTRARLLAAVHALLPTRSH